jgi:hypothetical protein
MNGRTVIINHARMLWCAVSGQIRRFREPLPCRVRGVLASFFIASITGTVQAGVELENNLYMKPSGGL